MTNILGSRNLGGILSETFRIYTRNSLRLGAIVAIGAVILAIWAFLVFLSSTFIINLYLAEQLFYAVIPFVLWVFILVVLFALWVFIVAVGPFGACPLIVGALTYAVWERSLGQTISIKRAYRFAWRSLEAMTGAGILAALLLFLMSISLFGIPVAIYFGVRWIFVWQAALFGDGLGPVAALSHSSDLVGRNWRRVLGIMPILVVGTIALVISFILGFIPVVGLLIGIILIAPFTIIGTTLLFYDLRVREEGYNLEELAQELNINISEEASSTSRKIAPRLT